MKLIKSTITALSLLFTVTACAGNKESKNQNMKGENMEIGYRRLLCYMVRPLQGIGSCIGRVGERI